MKYALNVVLKNFLLIIIIKAKEDAGYVTKIGVQINRIKIMKNREIASEINNDIKNGVYENFHKLEKRLEHIAHRLVLATYVDNIDLSRGEIMTLKENDYL